MAAIKNTSTFSRGDKVKIPLTKFGSKNDLKHSNAITSARELGQDHLYVVRVERKQVVLWYRVYEFGDFFSIDEVEHYADDVEKHDAGSAEILPTWLQ